MRLVLFDIDGALLRAQGVGLAMMERAGRSLRGPGDDAATRPEL